jgi:mono/diheme cytochrome c family protein
VSRRPGINRTNLVLALAAAGIAVGCRREAAVATFDHPVKLGGVSVSPERLDRGAVGFTHYCRACHGAAGDGAGPSALGLRPAPRDLRLGVYKFAAVAAGQLPNDADFRRIITGGLHGTAMLAWDLRQPELDDVIAYVKTFSPRWQSEVPGEPITLTPDPWTGRAAAGIERGRRVYHGLAQCAVACHPAYATRAEIFAFAEELMKMRVEEFRPDLYASVAKPSDFGSPIVPPDFTFNLLRAGESIPDIARAIASGVGGTAMPTWKNVLPDGDLWAMARYVGSLVALRGTPAADHLRARLLAQVPFVPPPPSPAGGARPSQVDARADRR